MAEKTRKYRFRCKECIFPCYCIVENTINKHSLKKPDTCLFKTLGSKAKWSKHG